MNKTLIEACIGMSIVLAIIITLFCLVWNPSWFLLKTLTSEIICLFLFANLN